MRLLTYAVGIVPRVGVQVNGWVVDLNAAYRTLLACTGRAPADLADALLPAEMARLLALGERALEAAREAAAFGAEVIADAPTRAEAEHDGWLLPLAGIRYKPPVLRPEKIICLGLNYRDHAAEGKQPIPKQPVLFNKFPNALVGHEEPIILPPPDVTTKVDYEVELAFVIGRRAHHVTVPEAYEYVAGYTIMQDVSARDLQFTDTQWMKGKTCDTFGPCGPVLVTRDEIPDPHTLPIRFRLNGDVLQDSNTRELIFSVPEIVAYCSKMMTLVPGDIISTGTPAGVGYPRTPPRFLRPGDVCECDIEGIGVLRNPVVQGHWRRP